MNLNINFNREWHDEFIKRMDDDGPWTKWELYNLALEAEKNLSIPDFLGLQAPGHLPQLTFLPHQLEVAKTVIEKMNGKAILADEVGLGKTIEAGLILKEYMIRGLAKKVLILVPASLVLQWTGELNSKFFIPAVAQKKSYVWEQCEVVVSSIDTAKRQPHRDIVLNQDYDIIVIDEAHKLKNKNTKNYEFVQHLKKKFCLLLTATPVQNRVEEIFNLVSLLKPGHLGNQENFDKDFRNDKHSLKNEEKLKQLVNKVMVRNRREETGLKWPKRFVKTIPITLSETERNLYSSISDLKELPQFSRSKFSVLTLQREVCSSREACFMTLKNMLQKDPNSEHTIVPIMKKIEEVTQNSKAMKTLELVQSINDKVIIFTEYRATQLYLQWYLQQHGISSVPFRGGFKRSKKDYMTHLFKNHAQVLIATEAGGEGINLQFCQHIINYDLPWNPMRIEQRIGRIHRIGQKGDVHIYNFATENTIEERILNLLYNKINLFESVIGELDEILAKFELKNIETYISDIMLNSESEGEMKVKMDNLASLINLGGGIKKKGWEEHATARDSSFS
ncbi:Helicase conserved C-terminal domain-containing protein [Fictibacillus solisalsi]|uniref:Helicase conserved C-terminal domain-containing protein n=1 Tax=Fictibacillus solisalsi TaxID=459525 RepID=A0A1G9WAR7_9BACL|nr:SNF2-related protein [Fictibacillus solisalsi]SDM81095.1 Helicase conserved C-terminal domain-containing protein [Fictibacillus solisalsi]